MSNIYPLIEEAQNYHRSLLLENRVFPAFFEGVQVFEINQSIQGRTDLSGNINIRIYTFTSERLNYNGVNGLSQSGLSANDFERYIHNPNYKRGICLHYTAGNIRGDFAALTGEARPRAEDPRATSQFVSTPFLICRAGYIYQLSNPDRELSWHLRSNALLSRDPEIPPAQRSLFHNQVIGIELSNFGFNTRKVPEGWSHHILHENFRNNPSFEIFTDAQYNSLRMLIKAICRRYPNIQFETLELPSRNRFFAQHQSNSAWGMENDTDREGLVGNVAGEGGFRGISSHLNWSAGAVDIGPAFDWDRLMIGPDEPRPLEVVDNTPTLQWYANTELRRKGGYFPVGCNGQIHTGVHIFSDATEAPVRSMADGYIAAFRFFNQEQEEEHSQNLNSLGITQARNNGFILIRHDFQRSVYSRFRADKIRLGYTSHTVYSLYMGFGLNIDQGQIPWVQNLLTNYSGMIPAEASCITEESRRLEGCNDVITFSRPLLPVKAGEVIWRTRGANGNNHIHWEIFTLERDLFPNIMGGKESIQPQRVSPWAYGNTDELNRLFSRSNFRFSPLLGIYGDRNTGILRDLKNLVPFIDNRITFKDFLREFFAANDTEYTGRIRLTKPGRLGNSQTVFRAFDRRRTELRAVMGKGRRIIVIPENRLEFELLARPSPNANNLIINKYSLQMTLQALQRTHSIQITRRMQGSNVWDDMGAVFEHRGFFRDFASNRQMLRNAHFSARSPWTKEFWQNAVGEFQRLGLPAFSDYEFDMADFISQMPLAAGEEEEEEEEQERPVYDSIFSGDTAFFTPESMLHYMHPVTFIWLQLLNVENRFLFTVPIADNNQFSGDTMIT